MSSARETSSYKDSLSDDVPTVKGGSTFYDAIYARQAAGKTDDLPQLFALLETYAPTSTRALCLCGGFGRVALPLAERGLSVDVWDLAKTQLIAGQEEACRRGLEVAFRQLDCTAPPEAALRETEPIDVVFCTHYAINEITEAPERLFQTAASMLIPKGILILQTLPRPWRPIDAMTRPVKTADPSLPTPFAWSVELSDNRHLLYRYTFMPGGTRAQVSGNSLLRRYWTDEALTTAAATANLSLCRRIAGGFFVFGLI
ncbi:MAG: class I SAM-dependent methyltransferase [Alphaproteobacteria bacterium GM202ARS2]|nr:class I SAM-dependent methyltransferase [Alphaproteobacteria bacterium GM202ARS2]